ncbi:MAG: platelet-activating factor acetylhydrolase IB subunit [Tepidisphaerales bacterium]
MFHFVRKTAVAAILALTIVLPSLAAQPKESAVEPKPRDAGWVKRHEGFVKEVKDLAGKVDLLFVGDSITDGWRGGGKAVWKENYAPLNAFNIGIGGDRTQHVIWRLQNGEVEGISPKLAVMMIGTNNLGGNTNDEIVAGITGCVKELQTRLPKTKVLLLGVFPRGMAADNPARARIKAINADIAKLDDGGKTVKYLDIGEKFLDKDGVLTKEIMPDALHPNAKGYQIWADAIKDTVAEMMK